MVGGGESLIVRIGLQSFAGAARGRERSARPQRRHWRRALEVVEKILTAKRHKGVLSREMRRSLEVVEKVFTPAAPALIATAPTGRLKQALSRVMLDVGVSGDT